MTSLPLSVLLSINFWIYSIDSLQLLISNPSLNLIMLHLCPVQHFIHMKKALHLATVQEFSRGGKLYLPTKIHKCPPCPLPSCMMECARKRCTCTHMTGARLQARTRVHSWHGIKGLLAGPVRCVPITSPKCAIWPCSQAAVFFHAWTHLHFDHPTRERGLSPWNNWAVAGSGEWARNWMSHSARPDSSHSPA